MTRDKTERRDGGGGVAGRGYQEGMREKEHDKWKQEERENDEENRRMRRTKG